MGQEGGTMTMRVILDVRPGSADDLRDVITILTMSGVTYAVIGWLEARRGQLFSHRM